MWRHCVHHLGIIGALLSLAVISILLIRESGGGALFDVLLAGSKLSFALFVVLLAWFVTRIVVVRPRLRWRWPLLIGLLSIGLIVASRTVLMNFSSLQYLVYYAVGVAPIVFAAALSGSLLSQAIKAPSRALALCWGMGTGLVSLMLLAHLTAYFRTAPATAPSTQAATGPYAVAHFTYGSATTQRQVQYQTPDWRSGQMDLSPLIPYFERYNMTRRDRFWGFSLRQTPLNAQVWVPKHRDQPAPLIVISHGDHFMEEYSELGYRYLGEHLAAWGYVVVSIDANMLNWGADGNFWRNENVARARLILAHLKQWVSWTVAPEHPMYNIADMQRIALIGHSRGGQAIVLAHDLSRQAARIPERANHTSPIQALIALAPTVSFGDAQIHPQPYTPENVHYLVLQGARDGALPFFQGQYHYENIRQTQPFMKAAVFSQHANHGQFNQAWSARETVPPFSWFYDTEQTYPAATQQAFTQQMVTAFLQTAFARAQFEAFSGPNAIQALWPQERLLIQFETGGYIPLADFTTTNAVVSTGAADKIAPINAMIPPMQQAPNPGLTLAWAESATLTLDASKRHLPAQGHLQLTHICVAPEQHMTIDVQITDAFGQHAQAPLAQPFCQHRPKPIFYAFPLTHIRTMDEPQRQTHAIALQRFKNINPALDLTQLTGIMWTFRSDQPARLIIDRIGLQPPLTGLK